MNQRCWGCESCNHAMSTTMSLVPKCIIARIGIVIADIMRWFGQLVAWEFIGLWIRVNRLLIQSFQWYCRSLPFLVDPRDCFLFLDAFVRLALFGGSTPPTTPSSPTCLIRPGTIVVSSYHLSVKSLGACLEHGVLWWWLASFLTFVVVQLDLSVSCHFAYCFASIPILLAMKLAGSRRGSQLMKP